MPEPTDSKRAGAQATTQGDTERLTPSPSGSATQRTIFGRSLPFYGWAIVAVATLVNFCSGPGQSYVFSVFIDPIIADTGLSRTTISSLYAVGTGVSAAMVVIVSRLVDRYGARTMLTAIGTGLGLACIVMSQAAGALSILLGFASLRALGQGSMTVTATLLANQWFVRKRGRAMAIVGLGLALSNAVIPPVARALIDAVDWRNAYVIIGVSVWMLIIPTALLVVRNRPEDIGLFPDGASEPPAGERRSTSDPNLGRKPVRVFSSPGFWLLAIPLSAPSFITTALVFHQVSIFGERGLSADVAAAVFVPTAIAAAATSMLTGILVDRMGPKLVYLINLGVLLLGALLILQTMSSPLVATIYAIVLGSSNGMQSVINGVTWAHYYGRRGLGRVQGAAAMVTISGAALGPLPVAAMQERSGNYDSAFLMLIALVVGCWLMAALYRPQVQQS